MMVPLQIVLIVQYSTMNHSILHIKRACPQHIRHVQHLTLPEVRSHPSEKNPSLIQELCSTVVICLNGSCWVQTCSSEVIGHLLLSQPECAKNASANPCSRSADLSWPKCPNSLKVPSAKANDDPRLLWDLDGSSPRKEDQMHSLEEIKIHRKTSI